MAPCHLTYLTLSPVQSKLTRGRGQRVLKLSSIVSDAFPKVLKLSCEVSECKPLPDDGGGPGEGAAGAEPQAAQAGHQRHARSVSDDLGFDLRPLARDTGCSWRVVAQWWIKCDVVTWQPFLRNLPPPALLTSLT